MKFHPITNIFPMMAEEEFKDLVEDIRKHGLREPIWTWEGRIIDGRNRYLACTKAGVEPQFIEWDGEESLVEFVVSLNLHRRHLSQSQKAMISENMLPFLEEEAKERQIEAGKLYGRGGHSKEELKVRQKIAYPIDKDANKSTAHAAKMTGTNRQYVSDAKKIKQKAPEIAEKVLEGKLSIPDAKIIVKQPEEIQKKVLEKVEKGEAKKVKEAIREVKKEEFQKHDLENNTGLITPRDICKEVASLSDTDLLCIYELRSSALSEEEIIQACGSADIKIKESIENLVIKGYIKKNDTDNNYVVSARGSFLSAYLYNFYYLILRSKGTPSFEDAEVVIYQLANIYDSILSNKENIEELMKNMNMAVSIATRDINKLNKILPPLLYEKHVRGKR